MRKSLLTFLIFANFCFLACGGEDFFDGIIHDWNNYEINITNTMDQTLLQNASFKKILANDPIDVLDFSDGKSIVGNIKKGEYYLVFAQTRFKINNSDKNWTWFLVVKYVRDKNNIWDGLIKIDQNEWYSTYYSDTLFLNFEIHNNSYNIASINNLNKKVSSVYYFDNLSSTVKKLDAILTDEIVAKINEKNKENYMELIYDSNINNNEYRFEMYNEPISYGYIIWNIETNAIRLEQQPPKNLITGREIE